LIGRRVTDSRTKEKKIEQESKDRYQSECERGRNRSEREKGKIGSLLFLIARLLFPHLVIQEEKV
jgi:hypothetical protein